MKKQNLNLANIQRLIPKGNRAVIATLAIATLLVVIGLFVLSNKSSTPKISCAELVKSTMSNLEQQGRTRDTYTAAYNELTTKPSTCVQLKDGKKYSGNENDFKSYYLKATIGYSLNKVDDAKADANKALGIYNSLPTNTKNADLNKRNAEALQAIKEGKY